MFQLSDADYTLERYNDMLDEAEQYRKHRTVQPKQPNLFNRLKSQLAALADLARPQRNRAQRA